MSTTKYRQTVDKQKATITGGLFARGSNSLLGVSVPLRSTPIS